jgi:hypothetical protein
MNVLRIDCKEQNGGFMHSVWDKINGNVHMITSCKFGGIMQNPADIKAFTADPKAFIASLEEAE